MQFYHRKRNWKYLLFGIAVIIFGVILYVSNLLVEKIAKEEQLKVKIWADAILHSAKLVNHTQSFFDAVRIEEAKHAEFHAKALRKVIDAKLGEDITFYTEVITSNTTIPVVIVSEKGNIDAATNTDSTVAAARNINEIEDSLKTYNKLHINYHGKKYIDLYFKDSKIYTDLHKVLDDLVLTFFQETVINTASVPIIITDSLQQHILARGNITRKDKKIEDDELSLIESMRSESRKLEITLPGTGACYVFYKESSVLRILRLFPIVQFGIILLFLMVAYLVFSLGRKLEQDHVWVGISKETAHQLGTPISSLLAWLEYLKENGTAQEVVSEMMKDVDRLEMIASRFSKIGSKTELKAQNIHEVIDGFLNYIKPRIPKTVFLSVSYAELSNSGVKLNSHLFEWALENVVKNAVDAMNGKGELSIQVSEDKQHILIDVIDQGKGIQKKYFKTIFQPGYTTKSRGWGLGLSLAKRIIKEYHSGKICVKSSQPGKTVIRILLKK